MNDNKIQQIREKYPIDIEEICLYNSFVQILGKTPKEYTSDQRKQRWFKMVSLDRSMKNYWSDTSACEGCLHLDVKDSWCNLRGLPCTYNPILTPRTGMIGMACYGAGLVKQQQELFDNETEN